jgi:anti-sigma B factor antagonist
MLSERRPQVVLELSGDLDVAAEAYRRMLARDLTAGDQLVLDLSELTFMDSTGIRLIFQARQHAEMHGAGFAVVRPPEHVLRVLELVGLDEQLELLDAA